VTVPSLGNRVSVAAGAAPLEALAVARERLIDASVGLQRRPGISRVGSGVDCRGYRSGSTFETYVEAEHDDGYTLTWWIEITWEWRWHIGARILRDDDDGQRVVQEFSGRDAAETSEFVLRLAEVIDEVVASIDHTDPPR
jgi:hypothetical protein